MKETKKSPLSALATEIQTQPLRRSRFAASVVSISGDHSRLKVKLCTGSVIDVPASLLKNMTYVGTASNENEHWGIASGEIDVSTDAGMLIQQMALEITRLSGSLQTAHEQLLRFQGTEAKTLVQTEQVPAAESKKQFSPFDIPLPFSVIKLPFTAVAGSPYNLWYKTPKFQYLKDWSVEPIHCVLTQPPQIIAGVERPGQPGSGIVSVFPTYIYFRLEAPPGTPLGATYNAEIHIFGVLVQETT